MATVTKHTLLYSLYLQIEEALSETCAVQDGRSAMKFNLLVPISNYLGHSQPHDLGDGLLSPANSTGEKTHCC